MTIRAVIFDLGHTLWDILPHEDGALDRAYEEAHATLCAQLDRDDLPPASLLRQAVSEILHESAETYFSAGPQLEQPPTHAWVDQAFRRLGLALQEPLLCEITPALFATETDRLHCADGTLEAVRALHDEGYALGCVTNTLASGETIAAMLALHGFAPLMRSVVVSSEEGWRKPHRSLFDKALREVGAEPQQAVFVGDSPWHDIAGAKAAGMYAVLTRQYVQRPADGIEPGPDAVIGHMSELRAAIERLQGAASADARPRSSPAGSPRPRPAAS